MTLAANTAARTAMHMDWAQVTDCTGAMPKRPSTAGTAQLVIMCSSVKKTGLLKAACDKSILHKDL